MQAANQILVFDRALVRKRRRRAAVGFTGHAALFEETAAHLIERLGDVKRDFKSILVLGARAPFVLPYNDAFIVMTDLAENLLDCAAQPVAADEEFLPFAPNSFDLVISNLNLHWVNDLPGALAQIKNILKPDGLFLASLLGGKTLFELRQCLMEAELGIAGGASPRLSPTIELQTASGLLQRAGFALPVADQ